MKHLLTGLLFIFLLPAEAQVKFSDDTLHWNVSSPLQWSDFKGTPEGGRLLTGQILCANLAGFSRPSAHHETQFNVVTVFDRLNSWMPEKDRTDVGLKYYQVMFNIYEVHARKMRKEYAESRSATDPDVAFREKYKTSGTDRGDELNAFKKETKMSVDTAAVSAWQTKVDEELKALAEYAK
jgi:hypothetical protein